MNASQFKGNFLLRDIPRILWKKVKDYCHESEITRREFVLSAIQEKIERSMPIHDKEE